MNFYEILQVASDATPEEIKRAFKKRAQVLHPDSGGGTEDFIELKKAYDTLINSDLRAEYDLTGSSSLDFNVTAKAVQLLVAYLDAVVSEVNIELMDIYELIATKINENKSIALATIKKLEAKIDRQTKAIARTKNAPRINMFHEGIIKEIRKQILSQQEVVAIADEMLEMLKDVEYEIPEPPPPTQFYTQTATTSTTW